MKHVENFAKRLSELQSDKLYDAIEEYIEANGSLCIYAHEPNCPKEINDIADAIGCDIVIDEISVELIFGTEPENITLTYRSDGDFELESQAEGGFGPYIDIIYNDKLQTFNFIGKSFDLLNKVVSFEEDLEIYAYDGFNESLNEKIESSSLKPNRSTHNFLLSTQGMLGNYCEYTYGPVKSALNEKAIYEVAKALFDQEEIDESYIGECYVES